MLSPTTTAMIRGSRSPIRSARSSSWAVEPPTWASTPLFGITDVRTSSTSSLVASELGEPSGMTLIIAALPSLETCGSPTAATPSVADRPWWSVVSSSLSPLLTVTSSGPLDPAPKFSVIRS